MWLLSRCRNGQLTARSVSLRRCTSLHAWRRFPLSRVHSSDRSVPHRLDDGHDLLHDRCILACSPWNCWNSPADNPTHPQPPSGPHSRSSRPCSSPPSPSLFSPSTTLLVSSGRADDFARARIERNPPQEATRLVSRAVFSDFVLYVYFQVTPVDVAPTPDCPVSLSSLPARYALCRISSDFRSQPAS